ncbi:type II toxin-antitoxin system HipA family toxin [Alcanivorax quisquiliarum]|uniref:Type II toxin-antitoxin system HipA family toxin n=1 Tax=Alcanivorax quisquiliarum TaxID=2933565 RepID=A0ABT0E9X1_9GAMM|nr:type II toxin-antitoxin system HipA family toxin [Alcanivorax quisquiliarum]MCK0538454.1 type II toxin-antitoxin system HipA family toxin [Alcanivorax quisquiliarum]
MSVTEARVTLWGADVGAVAWDNEASLADFQYAPAFIERGVEIAPIKMPLRQAAYRFAALNRETFHGLPGLLADSLPDRFGHALFDAWLARQGRSAASANPVERLCYVGRRGMGALEFEPVAGPAAAENIPLEVAKLVEISNQVLQARNTSAAHLREGLTADEMRAIIQVGTSAGGARAKAVIAWNPETGEVRSGQSQLDAGFEHWILKLDGISNNRDKETDADPQGYGIREYIYYEMALAAGITMTSSRLLTENGRSHFMTRRFDRPDEGGKLLMQSLCALGHYDYNAPGQTSYEELFHLMKRLGLGRSAMQEQFRRLVFNVLGCNRDDHTKNTAFLMDKRGQWHLSPAFDLTFAWNPQGRYTHAHQMSLNGKRDGIGKSDLMAVARVADISPRSAMLIMEQVDAALAQCATLCLKHGLPDALSGFTVQEVTAMRSAVLSKKQ